MSPSSRSGGSGLFALLASAAWYAAQMSSFDPSSSGCCGGCAGGPPAHLVAGPRLNARTRCRRRGADLGNSRPAKQNYVAFSHLAWCMPMARNPDIDARRELFEGTGATPRSAQPDLDSKGWQKLGHRNCARTMKDGGCPALLPHARRRPTGGRAPPLASLDPEADLAMAAAHRLELYRREAEGPPRLVQKAGCGYAHDRLPAPTRRSMPN